MTEPVRIGDATLYTGDVLAVLATLPDESVHCIVTSPPYYALRDYGIPPTVWDGEPGCAHEWGTELPPKPGPGNKPGDFSTSSLTNPQRQNAMARPASSGQFCQLCGAWLGSHGLEPTPELYVQHEVQIFREVRRVLRPDGTCWINLGDSYQGGQRIGKPTGKIDGLKAKDLVGVPWRVAFALQADGWYLRSDIIWAKPNPMPESVTDRPTKAHEYLFLLSKSAKYFYDGEAIREPHGDNAWTRKGAINGEVFGQHEAIEAGERGDSRAWTPSVRQYNPAGRNRRTVWTIATEPYPEAHFATFPRKLVQPCILAGCPEHACPKCGAPWEREVERERLNLDGTPKRGTWHRDDQDSAVGGGISGMSVVHTGPEHPTCACGLLSCTNCGMVIEYPHDKTMRGMRKGVRDEEAEGQAVGTVLQPGMSGQGNDNGAGENVPDVREKVPTVQAPAILLQPSLFSEIRGEESAAEQGQVQDDEGLRDDLQAGPSDSIAGRLHHGAPAGNGNGARPLPGPGGDRSSQEREQVGQPTGESRSDGQAGSRPAQETGMDSDLSPLSPDIPDGGQCPRCRGALTFRPHAPVPGTVMDIFGGSGTTAEVALEYGRRAVLIELKPDYVELQKRRLAPVAGRPLLNFAGGFE